MASLYKRLHCLEQVVFCIVVCICFSLHAINFKGTCKCSRISTRDFLSFNAIIYLMQFDLQSAGFLVQVTVLSLHIPLKKIKKIRASIVCTRHRIDS